MKKHNNNEVNNLSKLSAEELKQKLKEYKVGEEILSSLEKEKKESLDDNTSNDKNFYWTRFKALVQLSSRLNKRLKESLKEILQQKKE